jgi:hypothetical protein
MKNWGPPGIHNEPNGESDGETNDGCLQSHMSYKMYLSAGRKRFAEKSTHQSEMWKR